MQLVSTDGASVDLRPVRYEFADEPAGPGDWDANWLVIRGAVRTAAGRSWTFEDPCLTAWDARELGAWLRAAAEGRVPVTAAPDEDSAGLLAFTEPNLGFSLAARTGDDLVLRVHLSIESGPPPRTGDAPSDLYAYSVPLRLRRADLRAAAQAWETDLTPYPPR